MSHGRLAASGRTRRGAAVDIGGKAAQLAVVLAQTAKAIGIKGRVCIFGAPGLSDGGRGRTRRLGRGVVEGLQAALLDRLALLFEPSRGRRCVPSRRLDPSGVQSPAIKFQRVPAKAQPAREQRNHQNASDGQRQPSERSRESQPLRHG